MVSMEMFSMPQKENNILQKSFHFRDDPNRETYLGPVNTENKNRKSNDKELEALQAEIDELKAQEAGTSTKEDDPQKGQKKTPQKHNWEKRFKDGQSYWTKKLNEQKSLLEQQAKEIEDLKKASTPLPTSPEEFETWKQENPTSYKMVQMMLHENKGVITGDLEKTLQNLEAREASLDLKDAINQLKQKHPDWGEISQDPAFMDFDEEGFLIGGWLSKQPQVFINGILAPSVDNEGVELAAKIIQDYKQEISLTSNKKESSSQDPRDAAMKVANPDRSDPQQSTSDPSKKVWKESEIEVLTEAQYAKAHEDILLAQEEGRIEYDVSGAAQ
jgi:chaperonin cofactor prefoldin